MNFPAEAVRACDELGARFSHLAYSPDDNDRRTLTRLIGEQLAFALGDRWGNKKRRGLGDEWRSKDTIAYREDDGTISCWDWQSGATRQRVVNAGDGPTYPHLAPDGSEFMPCTPINHGNWGGAAVPPGPGPGPGTPPPTAGGGSALDAILSAHRIDGSAGRALADIDQRTVFILDEGRAREARLVDRIDALEAELRATIKSVSASAYELELFGRTVRLRPVQ